MVCCVAGTRPGSSRALFEGNKEIVVALWLFVCLSVYKYCVL